MIVDKLVWDYVDNIQPHCSGEVGKLQQAAYEEGLPIISNDVVRLLGLMLGMVKPEKILEIGMAVGFSASYMAGYLHENGSIKTIDRYPMMIERAKENFKALGLEEKITILEGSALEILPTLDENSILYFLMRQKDNI